MTICSTYDPFDLLHKSCVKRNETANLSFYEHCNFLFFLIFVKCFDFISVVMHFVSYYSYSTNYAGVMCYRHDSFSVWFVLC